MRTDASRIGNYRTEPPWMCVRNDTTRSTELFVEATSQRVAKNSVHTWSFTLLPQKSRSSAPRCNRCGSVSVQ